MKELWQQLRRRPLWLVLAALTLVCLALALRGTPAPGTSSGEEQRIAAVLSAIEGAGRVEVALHYASAAYGEPSAQPCGALVVAEGAEQLEVRLSLIRAMRTLLSLPENAVDVFPMKEAE